MDLLEYYLLVNLYILFFWIFFHFILKNESVFQTLRIYLMVSVLISILLPFVHNRSLSDAVIIGHVPQIVSMVENAALLPEGIFPITRVEQYTDYDLIIKYLILTGILIMLCLNLFRHLKIRSLVNKSVSIGSGFKNISVRISTQPISPFLYHKSIILPNSLSGEEMNIVVKHEYQHYILGHYFDNLWLQLFQIVCWINPFIYLIKRDLKLIHEYQVDRVLIQSGINASAYKLTLIKFCVGFQKFAIANGLSTTKIKKRITMMNNKIIKKWKWKFLLFIPAFFVAFLILSFATVEKDTIPGIAEQKNVENTKIELASISGDELMANNKRDYIIIMMNRLSQLLLNGREKYSLDEISDKITHSFQQRVSEVYGPLNNDAVINAFPQIKIVVQRSTKTNQEDYEKLLDYISVVIYDLHDIYSNVIYGKSYNLLESSEKEVLNNLIQPRIYKLPDKNI